jgi:c-di-AMP phosphodiesterase-like protein
MATNGAEQLTFRRHDDKTKRVSAHSRPTIKRSRADVRATVISRVFGKILTQIICVAGHLRDARVFFASTLE